MNVFSAGLTIVGADFAAVSVHLEAADLRCRDAGGADGERVVAVVQLARVNVIAQSRRAARRRPSTGARPPRSSVNGVGSFVAPVGPPVMRAHVSPTENIRPVPIGSPASDERRVVEHEQAATAIAARGGTARIVARAEAADGAQAVSD